MNQKILVIDDSVQIHTLVSSILADEPVAIHSALDPRTGLSLAASLRPDLILLDASMPDLDGFDICRMLKENPVTASLPIIFLTARAGTEDMARGLEAGANDYISKPFTPLQLLSRVRAAMRTGNLIRLLEDKVFTDSLTGLASSEMFEKHFAAEVAAYTKSGDPVSCIVADVDYLNDINEDYGFPFGDFVLSKIGAVLKENCRPGDIACRYSGQAFIMLLPNTTGPQADLLAHKMHAAIGKLSLSTNCSLIPVSCSLGVSSTMGVDDDTLVSRAERALCLAKERGRDCVCVAPASMVNPDVAA
jgi:diguanylate cyclase (GGDEF)-like protein